MEAKHIIKVCKPETFRLRQPYDLHKRLNAAAECTHQTLPSPISRCCSWRNTAPDSTVGSSASLELSQSELLTSQRQPGAPLGYRRDTRGASACAQVLTPPELGLPQHEELCPPLTAERGAPPQLGPRFPPAASSRGKEGIAAAVPVSFPPLLPSVRAGTGSGLRLRVASGTKKKNKQKTVSERL